VEKGVLWRAFKNHFWIIGIGFGIIPKELLKELIKVDYFLNSWKELGWGRRFFQEWFKSSLEEGTSYFNFWGFLSIKG